MIGDYDAERCAFCDVPSQQIMQHGRYVVGFWNPFASIPGEILVTTRQHVDDWFSLSDEERAEFEQVVSMAREQIMEHVAPSRVSVQIRAGVGSLSSSPHVHAHLTPVFLDDEPELYASTAPGAASSTSIIRDAAFAYDGAGVPVPHAVQQEALLALEETRAAGKQTGLVVLATGLGKTWLSAFDSNRPEFSRILFVAHREEILDQAFDTLSRIRPDASCGYYTGPRKDPDADILFASVQTLGRYRHLRQFAPDAFDYVIIDEFHHAAAQSYRRILRHFQPKFLLGLTATPERMDGQNLLALCGDNLIYQCDLREGIERDLLVPFHYFGVPDDVDYENIPWRSGRFDEEALTSAVATHARAQNALEQFEKRAGGRTLAFCASQRHANFMDEFFRSRGYRTEVVHSGPESAPRAESLAKLEAGELDVIFSIDMFNEGVDLPNVDTVMMLRPTESPVVWRQQLGRGLRKAVNKDLLTVIDYIGNHRLFLDRIVSLLDQQPGEDQLAEALARLETGETTLPAGCAVTYDLKSIEILRGVALPETNNEQHLEFIYRQLRDQHGVRPTATEMFHAGADMRLARIRYGSWFRFVDHMGDLSLTESAIVQAHDHFLTHLETTAMSKSYKMLVLLAMLERDQLPGAMSIDQLVQIVQALASRRTAIGRDIGDVLTSERQLARMLEQNPIRAWTGGKATGGVDYFTWENSVFGATDELSSFTDDERDVFQDLTRELVDWRLAQYFARSRNQLAERIVCNVSHSNGRPILFLPDRSRTDGIPQGRLTVSANGTKYEANFVKIAVNVLRDPESGDNQLPEILRGWFGPEAGQPATGHRAIFELIGDAYVLRPVGGDQRPFELAPWRQYVRRDIPPLFGLSFSPATWNQGIVFQNQRLILFVTIDKAQQLAEHQYEDRFLGPDLFQWQSQNRTTRHSRVGQAIRYHDDQNVTVHLFARAQKRDRRGGGAPFYYCGELEFVEWDGERPITVWWRLRSPVPEHLQEDLGLLT